MTVGNNFKIFCSNLRMNNETIEKIQVRYYQITKRINLDYWNSTSKVNNSLYVGSYGRGTEIFTSDIDIIIRLPYDTYKRFNNYLSNGQSALLQEVKSILQKTYSTSHIKGDGQVIGINFKDGINFEIVPGFINKDSKSYTYPDTNNGGSWKDTNPRSEIEAMNSLNNDTNRNLKRLCRMARAWKDRNNVLMSGILIDTSAYNFIKNWKYKGESYVYYDWMSRDFFKYLKDIDREKSSWLKPGSNARLEKNGSFQNKASIAYEKSLEAISYESNEYTAKQKWREIYGTKFPS